MLRALLWMGLLLMGCTPRQQAPAAASPGALPMTPAVWDLSAQEAAFVTHLGRPSVKLRGGLAILRGVELADGVLEFDMAADPGVAFSGIAFHLQDEGTFEKFYLRTFLSGSREASQYTPVFHHTAGWQVYHGPNFNQELRFRADAWTTVRVVVSGRRADIFVGDMHVPALHVDPLRLDASSGRVGLYNELVPAGMHPVATYFSNVRVTPALTPPALRGQLPEPVESDAGRVPRYLVSAPFDEAALADRAPDASSLAWTELASETTGLANLARLSDIGPGKDTVFARVKVRADVPRRARLRFGFSERVQVYVDGQRVLAADATWHSHDITFQGVIGWHDELTVDVAPAGTEIWFAVSENLVMRGGWAIQAAFVDPTGLTFL